MDQEKINTLGGLGAVVVFALCLIIPFAIVPFEKIQHSPLMIILPIIAIIFGSISGALVTYVLMRYTRRDSYESI